MSWLIWPPCTKYVSTSYPQKHVRVCLCNLKFNYFHWFDMKDMLKQVQETKDSTENAGRTTLKNINS